MKKQFYYIIKSEKHRKIGGSNVIAQVLYAKRNQIIVLGEIYWCTASFNGGDSSVYDFLYKKKFISKKEYLENHGYYHYTSSKIEIHKL